MSDTDNTLFEDWESTQDITFSSERQTGNSMFDEWGKANGVEDPSMAIVTDEPDIPIKKGLWETLNSPTAPKEFSWTNVGLSTGLGAGIGTVVPVVGTTAGAVSGFTSGVAGELSRAAGNRPLFSFGAEIIGGGITGTGKIILQKGGKAIGTFLSYKKQKALNLFSSSTPEERAIIAAKRKAFGNNTFDGLYTTENTDNLNKILRFQLSKQGINVPENVKVSDSLREQLFKDILEKSSSGKAPKLGFEGSFTHSTEVTSLLRNELDRLVKLGDVTKPEIQHINKILKSLTDPDAVVRQAAPDKLINLMQSGGSYSGLVKGEVQRKIGDPAADALKKSFDTYLERVTGKEGYKQLKQIEQQEFIALAQDSIPTILDSGFKFGAKETASALNNLSKSMTGRAQFVKALNQHFKMFGDTLIQFGDKAGSEVAKGKLLKEFHRLRPMIEKSGVMSKDQLISLRKELINLPENVSAIQYANTVSDLIKTTLIGAGASNVSTATTATADKMEIFSL